jgi:hypothetical protein
MKIHMDYLEGKVEEYENARVKWESEKRCWFKKMEEKVKKDVEKVRSECKQEMDTSEMKWREIVEGLQK